MVKSQEGCRRFDIFGHQINLNYRGSTSYRTPFGSCLSVIVVFIMLVVLAVKVKFMYLSNMESGLTGKTISQLVTYDDELLMNGFQLNNQERFTITIGLESLIGDQDESPDIENLDGVLFDPRHGYVKIELVEYLTDSYYNVQERSTRELGLVKCEDDSFVTSKL